MASNKIKDPGFLVAQAILLALLAAFAGVCVSLTQF